MITVTILGTAATMPLPERALASVLLTCNGRSILFDCGEGTQTAARKAHVSLMKTDLIALTHFHGDHLFGLPGLLQTYGCLGRTDPLYITGPEGIREVMRPVLQLSGALPYPVSIVSPDGETSLENLLPGWLPESFLSAFPTEHRINSQGYRFSLRRAGRFHPELAEQLHVPKSFWGTLQHGSAVCLPDGRIIKPEQIMGEARKGIEVVISGDTAPCANLREAARDADLLICDATYGSDEYRQQAEEFGHSTFSGAAALAAEAGVRRLLLTHFSQIMEQPEKFLPNALAYFPRTECCSDGMSFVLRFENTEM